MVATLLVSEIWVSFSVDASLTAFQHQNDKITTKLELIIKHLMFFANVYRSVHVTRDIGK